MTQTAENPLTHTALDPAQQSDFRSVLGYFATGLTIVTALTPESPVGFTCQSFSSLSLDPPLVTICPSRTSSTWPRIAPQGRFCVNVLAASQEWLSNRFATSGIDKYADLDWTTSPNGDPVLEGSLAWLDCRVERVHAEVLLDEQGLGAELDHAAVDVVPDRVVRAAKLGARGLELEPRPPVRIERSRPGRPGQRAEQVEHIVDFLLGVKRVPADEVVIEMITAERLLIVRDISQRSKQDRDVPRSDRARLRQRLVVD